MSEPYYETPTVTWYPQKQGEKPVTAKQFAIRLIDALDAARRSGRVVHEHELTEVAFAEAIDSEREACAKAADDAGAWCRSFGAEETAEHIAAAIRARTTTGGDV